MTTEYVDYWSSLGDAVQATGVANADDTPDFAEWSPATGFTLSGRVLDIGSGTGRIATLCGDYTGVDITPSFVEFARGLGRNVSLISGPADLPDGPFDRITMLSVMTHIPRSLRQEYLAAIRDRLGGEALVDILPGDEGGDVKAWYADPSDFEADLAAANLSVVATHEWQTPLGVVHRYYRVR